MMLCDLPSWDPPSDPVAELIRQAVARMLDQPAELFEQLDAAALGAIEEAVATDPSLVDAIRASNRVNLIHWVTANLRAPGMRVTPYVGPENVDVARDIVRRGFDESILASYRRAQNAAWGYIVETAFDLTEDRGELRELLDVMARSIFTFVDDTLAAIVGQIAKERDEVTDTTHVGRLEVVSLVLEGAPITSRRASERLGYELDGAHVAAVVWAPEGVSEPGVLEQAAEALARAAGARRPFTVVVGPASLWVWVPAARAPDLDALRAALEAAPDVRMALGSRARGLQGFRRSHLDAVATQRLLHRLPADVRLATYDEVRVVVLTAEDEERAGEFVAHALGALATAEPELRDTLRVYLREGSSPTRAARALFAHRNTVLNRLARARELLPAPLEPNALQIALALEIVHWLGPPVAMLKP